jgi:hypothetical protein
MISTELTPDNFRPLWFPGSQPPEWLNGSLPAYFGFDPLGLGSDPELLKWFVQAELVHCRWAMLGAASIFIPDRHLKHSLCTKLQVLSRRYYSQDQPYAATS